jgi:hypothetical protein
MACTAERRNILLDLSIAGSAGPFVACLGQGELHILLITGQQKS